MRKQTFFPYVFLFLLLMIALSLPKKLTQKFQGFTAAILGTFLHPFKATSWQLSENSSLYNVNFQLLALEIASLKELYQQEIYLLSQLKNSQDQQEIANAIHGRHREESRNLLFKRLQAIPAKVIFRSPASWHSSLWIDIGQQNHANLKKNSPVLVDSSVVGVIDYIGKKQSRVRLITDSSLTPSVRAARGNPQCQNLHETMQKLIEQMAISKHLFADEAVFLELIQILHRGQEQLANRTSSLFLAKGEIHGSSVPLWRKDGSILIGTGFNYDFADQEGPVRDLRTGKIDALDKESVPIIQKNDLLVTTGMDGIFPPGLFVAEVTSVEPLKEGDFFYEIQAKPSAGNLNEITDVYVIPPLSDDFEELPFEFKS